LNFNESNYVEFRPENYYQIETSVKYGHKVIANSSVMKFLGLIIDGTLSRDQHIDLIATKLFWWRGVSQ
jgi:hypothetical protein